MLPLSTDSDDGIQRSSERHGKEARQQRKTWDAAMARKEEEGRRRGRKKQEGSARVLLAVSGMARHVKLPRGSPQDDMGIVKMISLLE